MTKTAMLQWEKVESWYDWAALSEGCYLLRSNVSDWNAEELRQAYMQLTQAEAAFRIHKSDLTLRPIWHQNLLLHRLKLNLPSRLESWPM